MIPWNGIWLAWLIVALGGFVVLETWALVDRRDGDTLSENIRRWFGIYPASPVRRVVVPVFVGGMLGFVAWFVPHIIIAP